MISRWYGTSIGFIQFRGNYLFPFKSLKMKTRYGKFGGVSLPSTQWHRISGPVSSSTESGEAWRTYGIGLFVNWRSFTERRWKFWWLKKRNQNGPVLNWKQNTAPRRPLPQVKVAQWVHIYIAKNMSFIRVIYLTWMVEMRTTVGVFLNKEGVYLDWRMREDAKQDPKWVFAHGQWSGNKRKNDKWILNSGATQHMTNNISS